MSTDTTSKLPRSARRPPNDAGLPPLGSSLTEPATDLAPTADWRASESASTLRQPNDPALLTPLVGNRIIADRYCLVREIGRGGFGVVCLAYDRDLHRQVAIKIASCAEEKGVDELLEEGRKVALLDHENIVPVYDCGRIDGRTIFIVSKYIDGGSLARRLALRRLSIDEAVRIAGQVVSALAHAHERGLIHRDLKPSNILIDSADRVFVADFGLALRTSDRSDRYCVEGSPQYMSPEQAGGKSRLVDRRTDVFSFGVILFEMLTGKRPKPRQDDRPDLEPPPPQELNPEVPEPLGEICGKAMSRDPEQRHASAWELARELEEWQASRRRCPRLAPLLAATALLLLAALLFAVVPLLRKALTPPAATAPVASLDRELAQWVLARGGQIDTEDRQPSRITHVDQLPSDPFSLRAITLLSIRSVQDADVKRIADLKDLLYLHLSATRISDECGPDLARLSSLRNLWVGWNEIGDRGINQLGALKALEHLDLEHTNVTDLGVSAIVGSPGLLFLNLSETRITDAGLEPLRGLTNLRHLGLNRTAITDACVDHLLNLKSLRRLEIAETELSDAAVGRLRDGLKGCLVVR